MNLNGGDKPDGIYGYVDVFKLGGLLQLIAFGLIMHATDQFVKTFFVAVWMAIVAYFTPDIKLCKPGEMVYFGWDVCIHLLGGTNKESGLTGIWEYWGFAQELEEEANELADGDEIQDESEAAAADPTPAPTPE